MYENNENGGGLIRACGERFRHCLDRIRNFPFLKCFICFVLTLHKHYFVSTILFVCVGLTVASWFEFDLKISLSATAYCFVLVLCAGLSRFKPRGNTCIKKLIKQLDQRYGRDEVDQSPTELAYEVELQLDGVDPEEEGRPVSVSVEIYAHPTNESSNLGEPASLSSDPLQQAASSDSGSNLPRSSTDPSTQSTSVPPLE